jgi:hypothetical protein
MTAPAEAWGALWARYSDASEWGVNSVGHPAITIAGRVVTVFPASGGWSWIVRPRADEPLAWGVRDDLAAADARLEAFGALSLILRVARDGLALGGAIVGLYARLVIAEGVGADDERLAALREAMTPDEVELAKQAIAAELLRREPVGARPN